MVDMSVKITKAIIWALVIFIVGAIVDAFVTVWVFKKYGGCPMKPKK
jgi:hypothetical protein